MSTGCQKDRPNDRQTERLFSLVIKTKVVQNVNKMSFCFKKVQNVTRISKRKTDRQQDRQSQSARQTDSKIDRVPGRQTESQRQTE